MGNMKKLSNGVATQTQKQNVAFQFNSVVDITTINGTISKEYVGGYAMGVTPPGDNWNNYVVFNALDTEKHIGYINTDETYTFDADEFYKIESSAEGEYYVDVDEYGGIYDGTMQTLKVYGREDESTPYQIGLVSHFGDATTETVVNFYQYGPNRFANSFLGSDEESIWVRREVCNDEYYGFINDDNDEFYFVGEEGTTMNISITGEKTETSDWTGKLRYYVETATGSSVTSEGYVYINSRTNNGPIFPTREVIGQLLHSTGTQGNPTYTSITDIDIMISVNGVDYIKKKDVSANIESFSDIPFGMYWRADSNSAFEGWITE